LTAPLAGLPARIREVWRNEPESACFCVLAAANVTILFSIAISQILLGLALAWLLATRRRLQAPPIALPLACFALWTLAALAASPHPLLGLAQIKKLYIFAIVIAGYTAVRRIEQVDRVGRWLFAAGSAAALLATFEFGLYYYSLSSEDDFYHVYSLGSRITGFMGHWQTFSGQQMLVLAVLLSFLLFSRRRPWWSWTAAGLIALSLVLSFTRGVWLGCLAAAAYLLWQFNRRLLLILPAALLLVYAVSPGLVQERIRSFADTGSDSSSQARLLMLGAGWNMIRAHPLFGIGPDAVQHSFDYYRPNIGQAKPVAFYGHLHNNYAHIAAERGLPCLVFFLWLLWMVLRDQRRLAKQLPPEFRYLAHGIAAAVVALAVAGLFEYNFGDSEVAMLFLFYITNGCVLQRAVESRFQVSGASPHFSHGD
jgi:putative inorganic carbon (HCO3(-)) transporter